MWPRRRPRTILLLVCGCLVVAGWLCLHLQTKTTPPPPSAAQAISVTTEVYFVWCGRDRVFQFRHYLSVRSAVAVFRPDVVHFVYQFRPLTDDYNTWLNDTAAEFAFFQLEHAPLLCTATSTPRYDDVRARVRSGGGVLLSVDVIVVALPEAALSCGAACGPFRAAAASDVEVYPLLAVGGSRRGLNATCATRPNFERQPRRYFCVDNSAPLSPHDIWEADSAFGRAARRVFYGTEAVQVARPSDGGGRVPNVARYVWFGDEPLPYAFYLSIASALCVWRVERVYIHGDRHPHGEYWTRLRRQDAFRSRLEWVHRARPTGVFGQPVTVLGHLADIAKADIMVKYGGVLLDPDVVLTRPPDPRWFAHDFVVGVDFMAYPPFPDTLNMGVVLCRQGAPFARLWQRSQRRFVDSLWTWNSNQVTYRLLERNPGSALVVRNLQAMFKAYRYYLTWQPKTAIRRHASFYESRKHVQDLERLVYSVHFTWPDPFMSAQYMQRYAGYNMNHIIVYRLINSTIATCVAERGR